MPSNKFNELLGEVLEYHNALYEKPTNADDPIDVAITTELLRMGFINLVEMMEELADDS